jgi:hypothetical protein
MRAHPHTLKLWLGFAAGDQKLSAGKACVTAKISDDVDSIQDSALMGPRDVGVSFNAKGF